MEERGLQAVVSYPLGFSDNLARVFVESQCYKLRMPPQHLRIKAFFGTSENAVKTQIWIAISVYVLVAIVKKRLNLPRSLYETLQILSLTLCEQMPLDELLAQQLDTDQNPSEAHNQMNLFD